MKLSDKLNNIKAYPFHMPGHKRNPDFGITGSEIDITEIEGFDNLHNAKGVLLDIENRLSAHYKSKKSFMMVNGSTVGMLSAIFAVCNEGDTVIVARNCHKSVYNACMLRKLKVVYVQPDFEFDLLFYSRLEQETVDEALSAHPEAKALIITSPTYEGFISEISSPIPLIIDAAHGAHLGLGGFPDYPKGDIVVSSLHKTLPALTQTAVANIYNENFINKFKFYLDIFETSSPSYVLMSSVEKCIDYMDNNEDEFERFYDSLDIHIDCQTFDKLQFLAVDDYSKIVLTTSDADINGKQLADIFREKYNIEPEYFSKEHILLYSTVADSKETLKQLCQEVFEIDDTLESKECKYYERPEIPKGAQIISVDELSNEIEFNKSAGKTANEFVFAYPPDVPLIVPGEIITQNIVDYICDLLENGVNVISDSGLFPDKILTKAE